MTDQIRLFMIFMADQIRQGPTRKLPPSNFSKISDNVSDNQGYEMQKESEVRPCGNCMNIRFFDFHD